MRTPLISTIAIIFFSLAACNSAGNKERDTSAAPAAKGLATQAATAAPGGLLSEVLSAYLRLKNALADDNGEAASKAGKALVAALNKVDVHALPPPQQKVYQDELGDLKEDAEHIGANADKIAHQREHFEFLSQDLYTLVKAAPGKTPLYKDFCPMYNNEKGAYWISETKDIKNPYLGKKMTDCGEIQEEIK